VIPFWVSALGMTVGAALGAYAIVDPKWAAKLVRLREDGPGGFAEFRGTFGGLFFGSQAAALFFMVAVALEIEDVAGVPTYWTAMGAAAVCAAMWIGTGLARALSMALDGTGTKFNQASVALELCVGAAILTPWFLR